MTTLSSLRVALQNISIFTTLVNWIRQYCLNQLTPITILKTFLKKFADKPNDYVLKPAEKFELAFSLLEIAPDIRSALGPLEQSFKPVIAWAAITLNILKKAKQNTSKNRTTILQNLSNVETDYSCESLANAVVTMAATPKLNESEKKIILTIPSLAYERACAFKARYDLNLSISKDLLTEKEIDHLSVLYSIIESLNTHQLFNDNTKKILKDIFLTQPTYIPNIAKAIPSKFDQENGVWLSAQDIQNILHFPQHAYGLGHAYRELHSLINKPNNWREALLQDPQRAYELTNVILFSKPSTKDYSSACQALIFLCPRHAYVIQRIIWCIGTAQLINHANDKENIEKLQNIITQHPQYLRIVRDAFDALIESQQLITQAIFDKICTDPKNALETVYSQDDTCFPKNFASGAIAYLTTASLNTRKNRAIIFLHRDKHIIGEILEHLKNHQTLIPTFLAVIEKDPKYVKTTGEAIETLFVAEKLTKQTIEKILLAPSKARLIVIETLVSTKIFINESLAATLQQPMWKNPQIEKLYHNYHGKQYLVDSIQGNLANAKKLYTLLNMTNTQGFFCLPLEITTQILSQTTSLTKFECSELIKNDFYETPTNTKQ